MKNKKSQFKSMLSMLTLMLAMSVILTLPDADSILQQPSVGEEAPDRDEDEEPREQPLTDMDEIITALKMAEKYTL